MELKGRPRCRQACCSEEAERTLTEMYAIGMTVKEIAQSFSVSDQHIRDRFKLWGVKLRGRGRYLKKKSGESRKTILWYISEEELFNTPIKQLALKYHMTRDGVYYVKRRRQEANQQTNEKSDN